MNHDTMIFVKSHRNDLKHIAIALQIVNKFKTNALVTSNLLHKIEHSKFIIMHTNPFLHTKQPKDRYPPI